MGRTLSEVERAYIAGLLDADGAIMASIERHPEKKYGFRVRVALKLTQSKPELLNWVKRKISFGHIRKNRTTYDWVVNDQKHILIILSQVIGFLRVKRKQGKLAIRILSSPCNSLEDLIRNAQLADTLASFNVRSKNRRLNFASKIQESVPRND